MSLSTQQHSIINSNGKITISRLHGRVHTFHKLANSDNMAHSSKDVSRVNDSAAICNLILMKRDSAREDYGVPMLLVQRYLTSTVSVLLTLISHCQAPS